MKYQISILLVLAFLAQQSSCNKNCVETTYNFQMPLKAYPDNDSINIGDTIWFEIDESVLLKNSDGTIIDYSGASNLGSAISFGTFNSTINSWQNENPDSFTLLISDNKGTKISQTSISVEYNFEERNSRYVFKLAAIPKKKGKFSVLFSNSNNTFRSKDKCTKANFTLLFENTNQHYPLNPFYLPGTNPKGGDYYFVVK